MFILDKSSSNASYVTLRCLWGSKKPIENLLKHIHDVFETKNTALEVRWIGDDRNESESFKKRCLDTIGMEPDMRQLLLNDLQEFFADNIEDFYHDLGMPYRRGYMLYDPPGIGKTSLSKAIASEYNLELIIFDLANITDAELHQKFKSLLNRCVVLFEDIDNAGIVRETQMMDAEPESHH